MISFHGDKSDCSAGGSRKNVFLDEHEQKQFEPEARDNTDMTVKLHNHVEHEEEGGGRFKVGFRLFVGVSVCVCV